MKTLASIRPLRRLSLSLLALVSLASAAPPGGTPAEPYTPLPDELRHGINLSSIYLNVYAWHLGLNPYNPTFTAPLLDSTDMPALGEKHSPTYRRFESARIAMEPFAFGANPNTGVCDIQGPATFGPNPVSVHDNYVNLVHDMHLLEENGFAPILDCHPIFLTATHYNTAFGTMPAPWPGPYRKTFVTAAGGVVTSSHPLVNFWRSFLTNLNGIWAQEYPLEVFPENVVFEVMNEPLANLSVTYDESNLTGSQHDNYVNRCTRDWRNIQKEVVKMIWGEFSGFKSNRIMVTNGKYLAKEIGKEYSFTDYDGITQYDHWKFLPYSSNELSIANYPNPQYNLIYSVHQYSPLLYTQRWYIGNPNITMPAYKRIFGDNDPAHSDYPEDTADPGVARYPKDNVLNGINPTQQWRIDHGMPPMFTGEFGVKVISEADLWGGNSSADPNELLWRGQWVYDNRVDLENYGIGWCYFDYCSQFGCFTGRFMNSQGVRQNRGSLESNSNSGLFGTVRPQ